MKREDHVDKTAITPLITTFLSFYDLKSLILEIFNIRLSFPAVTFIFPIYQSRLDIC